MSVIVKGMEMPKKCTECPFGEEDARYFHCPLAGYVYVNIAEYGRLDECPLIALPERHGDLIDRDKLLRDIDKYHVSNGKFEHWTEVQQPVIEAEGE